MATGLAKAGDTFYQTFPTLKLLVSLLTLNLGVFPTIRGRSGRLNLVTPAALLFALGWLWLSFTSAYVPDPYLDEVFHVPQAQRYCRGKWTEWDDKITTPPGLYAVSVLPYSLKYPVSKLYCGTFGLRSVNVWSIMLLGVLAAVCRGRIELNLAASHGVKKPRAISHYAIHTGFNVALFPVLFFFSGVYYTDVMSTLTVLLAYSNHLTRVSRKRSSFLSDLWTIILGLATLTMRQTNIFWVVVYMGGVEAVHAVKAGAANLPTQHFSELSTALKYFFRKCSLGDIHDLPVNRAGIDDLLSTLASLALAAVYNPVRILKQVWPHITILASFGAFVYWNGGVVLGDKSNHVATIHLAQMLYIWPLMAFFSAPLFLTLPFSILRRILSFLGHEPVPKLTFSYEEHDSHVAVATGSSTPGSEPAPKRPRRSAITTSRPTGPKRTVRFSSSLPRVFDPIVFLYRALQVLVLCGCFVAAALLIVRYNTVIHPFTLADNRHYMFYVFRYTVRQPGAVRYYLVAPYLASALLVLKCVARGARTALTRPKPLFFNNPLAPARALADPSMPKVPEPVPSPLRNPPYRLVTLDVDETAASAVPTTTVLLLLLATALSLVTAPLVEPRYFIIPWVMWRLLVPAWSTADFVDTIGRLPLVGWVMGVGARYDLRLFAESLWFVVVNVATMYVFIAKPYQWRAEDGMVLDEGRLQRFMW